jgi:hypothetical protein
MQHGEKRIRTLVVEDSADYVRGFERQGGRGPTLVFAPSGFLAVR